MLVILLGTALLITTSAVSQQNQTVIDAVHKGHPVGHEQNGVEAVRTALAAGGNVNESDKSGWTPLMYAALECRANIVKFLLDNGANVNARSDNTGKGFLDTGQTALLIASGCFHRSSSRTTRPGAPHVSRLRPIRTVRTREDGQRSSCAWG